MTPPIVGGENGSTVMLEAAAPVEDMKENLKKEVQKDEEGKKREGGRDRDRDRSRDRDRDRDRRSERKKSKSRDRDWKRSKSRDRTRRRSKSRDRERKESRSRDRRGPQSRSHSWSRSRDRSKQENRQSREKEKPKKKKSKNWDYVPDAEQLKKIQTDVIKQMMSTNGVASANGLGAAVVAAGGLPAGMTLNDMQKLKHQVLQARRLYLGGVGPGITEDGLRAFIDETIARVGERANQGPACNTVMINLEKGFAFVQFHHLQDTDIAVCMDGIVYLGAKLPVKRPNDYVRPMGTEPERCYAIEGVIASIVAEDEHRLYMGNLPGSVEEDDIRGFVQTFGVLRSFAMARDSGTDKTQYAFFAYADPAVRANAIVGLHGIEVGGVPVVCRDAADVMVFDPSLVPNGGMAIDVDKFPPVGRVGQAFTRAEAPHLASCSVELLNACSATELVQDREAILASLQQGCETLAGAVRMLHVTEDARVRVRFLTPTAAAQARDVLMGRRFQGRTLIPVAIPDTAIPC